MRNLKLLATVIFVAVLLVGVVFLLRQTNTQNDTSVTSTQVTNQQLATNTVATTDPPVKVTSSKGLSVVNDQQLNVKTISKEESLGKQSVKKTSPTGKQIGKSISSIRDLGVTSSRNNVARRTTTSGETWDPKAPKAQQIKSLQNMLRQETNPKIRAKIQHKLNNIK